ncbi:MAG: four helix bundle protein [Bacteroidetes bacterium]|nr:four helix bundle protein [Bacteroidota bacterium]
MFVFLKHQSLDIYKAVRELVKETYKISCILPTEEKFNRVQQIRRAALSVKLNIAECSTRRSLAERKRFFEISRGSLIEIDAVLETAVDLNYFTTDKLETIGILINRCFAMISKMIND